MRSLWLPNHGNVPNAPCGVERLTSSLKPFPPLGFLMHRVELKVCPLRHATITPSMFLMHRVELKVLILSSLPAHTLQFLMHRVELKVQTQNNNDFPISVPNAPCGVESTPYKSLYLLHMYSVPNAPCGVERPAAVS